MTHDLILRLTVPGEPIPKARPRVVVKGGRTFAYTPRRTMEAEGRIGRLAELAGFDDPMHNRNHPVESGPLALTCRFYRATGRTADLDNLCKTVKDALNGIVWKDDRQIIQLHAARFDRSPEPRTEIVVHRVLGGGQEMAAVLNGVEPIG